MHAWRKHVLKWTTSAAPSRRWFHWDSTFLTNRRCPFWNRLDSAPFGLSCYTTLRQPYALTKTWPPAAGPLVCGWISAERRRPPANCLTRPQVAHTPFPSIHSTLQRICDLG